MLPIKQESKTMSSLEIAELTGKQHKDVLENIRKVLTEAEINSAEFSAQYKDSTGRSLACFNLPKRECDLVVSGYSVKYRLAIIDRWQELEQKVPSISDPQIAAMMLILTNLDVVKTQQEAQKLALAAHSSRLDEIEARNSDVLDGHGFFSILGYSKLKGVKLDVTQSSALGKKATAESTKHGLMMGSVPDARYGRVKTYHEDILSVLFKCV
jgi:phage regulator Rha-like protein